jgi:phospholipid/cholesterol/gamma-HCH transport system permease protein
MYLADLVGLGMTREMGALMVGIIMAGRTGASYAAQIGTMNVNSEIDALKTMGFNPMEFLVMPRMLALILVMPLLCLYADFMGMLGGAAVAIGLFDISSTEYWTRTELAVQLKDVLVGLFKASIFGILIAYSGCIRGMQCGRSASAVGDAATSAVVTGIIFIVISDSLITILFNQLGI